MTRRLLIGVALLALALVIGLLLPKHKETVVEVKYNTA